MALVLADRVKETTTTTGTGTVTLLGASTGYQSFAAVGNGNTTYYCIAGQTGSEWEVGIGTYTSVGTTLARTTVLASSNAGALVTFSAGTKDVFVTQPAKRAVYDSTGSTGGTDSVSTNTANTVVRRDASGNFSAGTITAALSGNASTASNASLLNSISAVNLYNNMGDVHGTRTSFDAQGAALSVNFGYRYVQGNTNAPNVGNTGNNQYYAWVVGLGSDYASNSYAAQFAIPRNSTTPYLSVRFEEGGVLGAWQKLSAGYADSAGSATTATNLAGGSAGTIPYQSAAGTTVQLAAGTAGQILQSNGAAAPSWVTNSGASKAYVNAQRILFGF